MARKESTDNASSIAGKVLSTGKATPKEVKTLAASVLGQDEKGRGGTKPPPSAPKGGRK